MCDPIVVSFGDAVLRESDVALLSGSNKWLNDSVIGFYFEYLHENSGSDKTVFISPEVSQFLKMGHSDEIRLFLEPLDLLKKEVISLAVNNASEPEAPGGTHWSFLLYSKQSQAFYHMDSLGKANEEHARITAQKIYNFIKEKQLEIINNFDYNSTRLSKFSFVHVPVYRQSNGYDCGVHVLCHAQEAVQHFFIYGSPEGLKPLDDSIIKKKRKEVLNIINALSK